MLKLIEDTTETLNMFVMTTNSELKNSEQENFSGFIRSISSYFKVKASRTKESIYFLNENIDKMETNLQKNI